MPEEKAATAAGFHWPCAFEDWDELRNRYATRYPTVNCGFMCETCGWNPEVARKRTAKWKKPKRRK